MVSVQPMRVSLLSVTPVKGLAVQHPDQVEVTFGGIKGDRSLFLVDDSGELMSCWTIGELIRHRAEYDPSTDMLSVYGPEGLLRSDRLVRAETLHTDFYGLRSVTGRVAANWTDLFSQIAGRPLRVVVGDSAGWDVFGLTLLGSESVAALAPDGDERVDARRFRMNVEIAGSEPHDEDTWAGRELRVGGVRVRVGGPVKRCVATTRNPDTGVIDLQTLKMIGKRRGRQSHEPDGAGFYFGVYGEVLVEGRINLGDEVALVD